MDKYVVIICLAALILLIAGFYIYEVSKKPKDEQLEELKKWLRYLVWEAEEYFGSKTGQLKLAMVYNLAVKQFPWIAYIMTYEEFDQKYVKEALKWLEKQLSENPKALDLLRSTMLAKGLNVSDLDKKYSVDA
ncbi:MAG: hypothetical protein J6U54_17250 [Clostridiales bacterium]|nr:hypothetical protein [Clostridiales bacterium]